MNIRIRKTNHALILGVLAGLLVLASSCFAAKPLSGLVIMLDPGHGGADCGAVGPKGLKESATNLRVAKYLGALLRADGAKVIMTRETDVFLTLQERVDLAAKIRPDLFVSIHHNASLNPKGEYPGEIYFNALDRGVPQRVADEMGLMIKSSPLASGSVVIPGGFFVLRNNPVPAILTEASYISVPKNEKALRLGRALTDEASALRKAIRKAFLKQPLKVQIVGNNPCRVTTSFFNLLLSSDKPISRLEMHVKGPGSTTFRLEKLPTFGNTYSLLNLSPLPSGDYTITFSFAGEDGSISALQRLNLEVRLPVVNSLLVPVAPFIPSGFRGGFPLQLVLQDGNGRVNPVSVPFEVGYGSRKIAGTTGGNGKSCVLLDMTGAERGTLPVKVVSGDLAIADLEIPIYTDYARVVLGKVVASGSPDGLEKVKIMYGGGKSTLTGIGGYFFLHLPPHQRRLSLEILPPLGFAKTKADFSLDAKRVQSPEVVLNPIAPGLMNKSVGLIARKVNDQGVRILVRNLMQRGAKVVRLPLEENTGFTESMAVARANSMEQLNLLVTLKGEPGDLISLRHYHKGGTGKTVCEKILKTLLEWGFKAKVEAGSEYELNHSGAPAVVVTIPESFDLSMNKHLVEALTVAMEPGW